MCYDLHTRMYHILMYLSKLIFSILKISTHLYTLHGEHIITYYYINLLLQAQQNNLLSIIPRYNTSVFYNIYYYVYVA